MSLHRQFASFNEAEWYADALFVARCQREGVIPAAVLNGTQGWVRNSVTGELVLPQKTLAMTDIVTASDGTAVITHHRSHELTHGMTVRVRGRDIVLDGRPETAVERGELPQAQQDALMARDDARRPIVRSSGGGGILASITSAITAPFRALGRMMS